MAKLSISGIYCIRCATTGKVYVGSSINVHQRWRDHQKELRRGDHHSRKLQRSWAKNGAHSFAFEVLETVEDTRDLVSREQYWIDALQAASSHRGLNISPTAGSALGVKHSAEARRRMSESARGSKKAPRSETHRKNASEALKARWQHPEMRAGLIHGIRSWKRPPRTEEYRQKMSAVKAGCKLSDEHKARIGAANRGRKRPDLAARNRSNAAKQKQY